VGVEPGLDQGGQVGGILGVECLELFEEEWKVGDRAGGGGHGRGHVGGPDSGSVFFFCVGFGGFGDDLGQGGETVDEAGDRIGAYPQLGMGLHEGFHRGWFCYPWIFHCLAI